MKYAPGIVPQEPNELRRYLSTETQKLAASINDTLTLTMLYAEPDKPRTGIVVLADGTQWDPGEGAGVYAYYDGAWNKLG